MNLCIQIFWNNLYQATGSQRSTPVTHLSHSCRRCIHLDKYTSISCFHLDKFLHSGMDHYHIRQILEHDMIRAITHMLLRLAYSRSNYIRSIQLQSLSCQLHFNNFQINYSHTTSITNKITVALVLYVQTSSATASGLGTHCG